MLAVGYFVAALGTLDVGVMRCTVTLLVNDVEPVDAGSNVSDRGRFDFDKSVSAQASFHSLRSIFTSGFGEMSANVVFLNKPVTGDELGTAGDSVIDDGKSGVFANLFAINSGFSKLVLSKLTSGGLPIGLTGFLRRDRTSGLPTMNESGAAGFLRLVSESLVNFGLPSSGANISDPLELSLQSKPTCSCLTIFAGLEGDSTALRFTDDGESKSGL